MLQYLKQQVRATEDLENQVVMRTEMARCHLILARTGAEAEANTKAEEQLRESGLRRAYMDVGIRRGRPRYAALLRRLAACGLA